jgi:hypothetical protein
MTLVLVMILAALIALFIAVTVGVVIIQRRPRPTGGDAGDACICRAGDEATHRRSG